MDYTDLLRRLSLHDERAMADILGGAGTQSRGVMQSSIRERWR